MTVVQWLFLLVLCCGCTRSNANPSNADPTLEAAPYGEHHELFFTNDSFLNPVDQNTYYFSNLGFAVYDGSTYITVRRWYARRSYSIWRSNTFLCNFDMKNWSYSNCREVASPKSECIWLEDWDASGVEDARLFSWPGKGLYAIIGAKPPRVGKYPFCGKFWFTQYITQVLDLRPKDRQQGDPWNLPLPVALLFDVDPLSKAIQADIREHSQVAGGGDAGGSSRSLLITDDLATAVEAHRKFKRRDKNWVPFIHNDKLLISRSLQPHIVVQPSPDGTVKMLHATENKPLFQWMDSRVAGKGPRGSTPAIIIPPSVSKEPEPFYLGMFHYSSVGRDGYRNFFYRMEADPPFMIVKVSSDVPLKRHLLFFGNREPIAFPCGLELVPGANKIVVSYGSGDHRTAVLVLTWEQVTKLFQLMPYMKTE